MKKKNENQTFDINNKDIESKEENICIKIKKIENKIDKLKKEKKNIRLRYYAKIDNMEKNTAHEIKIIKKNIFKNFLHSIFPVIDEIDSLACYSNNVHVARNALIEGIKLTKNILEKNLNTWKIKKIDQINIKVDPNKHDIQTTKEENHSNKTKIIKKIVQNGFVYKNKIIKKAIVTI